MEGKFAFHVFFLTCPQPAAINSRGLGIGSSYSTNAITNVSLLIHFDAFSIAEMLDFGLVL